MDALGAGDWGKAAGLYLQGLYWAYLLRVWPLERVLRLLRLKTRRASRPCRDDPARIARLVGLVIRRSTVPFASRCLVRSLVLFSRLGPGRPGLRLHLGMRPGWGARPGPGHAWVTLEGRGLLPGDESAAAQYREFLVLEAG